MITKAKGLRKSPNCRPDCHIRLGYQGIYNFAVAAGYNHGGECWLSQATLAKWRCCSRKTAGDAIKWLVENGWLIVIEEARQGHGAHGTYRVVDHEEWIESRGNGYGEDGHACVTQADDAERRPSWTR
jgi:hypothetical protein